MADMANSVVATRCEGCLYTTEVETGLRVCFVLGEGYNIEEVDDVRQVSTECLRGLQFGCMKNTLCLCPEFFLVVFFLHSPAAWFVVVITVTSLNRNMRTVCILTVNTNGYYISGQSGTPLRYYSSLSIVCVLALNLGVC